MVNCVDGFLFGVVDFDCVYIEFGDVVDEFFLV